MLIILGSFILANKIYINKKNEQLIIEEKTQEQKKEELKKEQLEKEKERIRKQRLQETIYQNCLKEPFVSEETEEEMLKIIEEYQDKKISFSFKEIENEYELTLRDQEVYYGASIIKLLESVYLIEKAIEGKINLEEELVYEKRHISDYSSGMEKYEVGDKISLKELIYYSISVSDNTAHEIIYEYIGIENLKEYAKNMNINLTINENEHFGNLTAEYGIKILEKAYKIIKLDNEYSSLLLESMDNDYYNSLNFKTNAFLHKYGYTEPYYNDIGIYYAKYPYLISVFTMCADEDYKTIVSELSEKIYNIYQNNIKEKIKKCTIEKNSIE